MTVSTHGVIRGRQIRLDHDTGLPAGARVQLRIKVQAPSLEEKRRLAARLCGSCADDPSFADAVAKIEKQRRLSPPREVDFDVAP